MEEEVHFPRRHGGGGSSSMPLLLHAARRHGGGPSEEAPCRGCNNGSHWIIINHKAWRRRLIYSSYFCSMPPGGMEEEEMVATVNHICKWCVMNNTDMYSLLLLGIEIIEVLCQLSHEQRAREYALRSPTHSFCEIMNFRRMFCVLVLFNCAS